MPKRITVTISDGAYDRLMDVVRHAVCEGKRLTQGSVVDDALTHFLTDWPDGYDEKEPANKTTPSKGKGDRQA